MYAVTSTPLDSRTRATLRSAEFGFFGVVVYTRVQTPRRWGEPFRAGVLFFDTLSWRPLRTSWLMVGTAWFSLCRLSESVLLMGHPRGRACRPPRAAAGTPLRLAFDRVLRTQPRAALPRTHDDLAVPGTIAKTTGCPEEGQNAGDPPEMATRLLQSTDPPKRETAGQVGFSGVVEILSHRVAGSLPCLRCQSREANSCARCSDSRPSRSASWVRHENPSASTTASGCARTAGPRSCS